MKHLVNVGATYKPKKIGSTLKKIATREKTNKCTLPSVYMKHLINVSATYKPKQCIGQTSKQKHTTPNDHISNQLSTSNKKLNQSKIVGMDTKINGRKRRQVEVVSHIKRKIKKKLPPIRIGGKLEVKNKCRKRKIDDSVGIRDSNSGNVSDWKKGTEITSPGRRKAISEVNDRLRHKKKLNHNFMVINKAASPPEKYRS